MRLTRIRRQSFFAPACTQWQFAAWAMLALIPVADCRAGAQSGSGAAILFDASLLRGAAKDIDLSTFWRGNPTLPGKHWGSIYLNDQYIGKGALHYVDSGIPGNAQACLREADLQTLGINAEKLERGMLATLQSQQGCLPVSTIDADAQAEYDINELVHRVQMPQMWLLGPGSQDPDPAQADSGINAFRMNYSVNASNTWQSPGSSRSVSGMVEAGFNIGRWRIRSDSDFSRSEATSYWKNNMVYAQTDLVPIKSRLTIGETFTDGTWFDSYSITGAVLNTHTPLLKRSEQTYTPVLSGIATSNAKVVILQNGYKLFETTVPTGPFEFRHVSPYGYGDIEVQVHEANGEIRKFITPYTPEISLQTPGSVRYNASFGKVRGDGLGYAPWVGQINADFGISNHLSTYAGGLVSERYTAGMIGGKFNTGIGGFAIDSTIARTMLNGTGNASGYSLGAKYNRNFGETGTNFDLAAYRYSSHGYWSFNEAITAENMWREQKAQPKQTRDRLDLIIRQSLGDAAGSLNLAASHISYRQNVPNAIQYQLSYGNSYKSLRYSLNAIRTQSSTGSNNYIGLSLSIPLGKQHSIVLGTSQSGAGNTGYATLNGTAGAERQFTWGVTAAGGGGSNRNQDMTGSFYGNYTHAYGVLNTTLNTSQHNRQLTLGASGGLIVHPDGVTFGQTLGDASVLLESKNLAGAVLSNDRNNRIDGDGYTIIASVQPYSKNSIAVDPGNLPLDTELHESEVNIVPGSGAIVRARLAADIKKTVIFDLVDTDGKPLSFGSMILDEQNQLLGVVGQGGRAILRGVKPSGVIAVRGASPCLAGYELSQGKLSKAGGQELLRLSGVCHSTPSPALYYANPAGAGSA